jgi:hypothetical protein
MWQLPLLTTNNGGYGSGLALRLAGTTRVNYFDLCIAGFPLGLPASLRLCAVLISAICVNACGKLPV